MISKFNLARVLYSLTFCLFLTSRLFACVLTEAAISDVNYRGNHQQAGQMSFRVNNDVLASASSGTPLYLKVSLDHQSRLADTLVLQSSSDPFLMQPICLPLRLEGKSGLELVAHPEAVRIVRWVAGEDAFWIEVTQSSDLWLSDGNLLSGPNASNQVSFTLGQSARASDQGNLLGIHANLPFATRDSTAQETEYEAAISTQMCLDLRSATLTADGSLDSLLSYDASWYLADANQGGGLFAAGTALGCVVIEPGASFARGKRLNCDQSAAQLDAPLISNAPQGLLRVRQSLTAAQTCESNGSNLAVSWASGSSVHLIVENGGFEDQIYLNFGNGWTGYAAVRPETAFQLRGQTLYREADLFYTGPSLATTDLALNLSFEILQDPDFPNTSIQMETFLLSEAGSADSAPYTANYQNLRCATEPIVIAFQELNLWTASVPAVDHAGRIALFTLLILAGFIFRRRQQRMCFASAEKGDLGR